MKEVVVGSVRRCLAAWREIGASEEVLTWIEEGVELTIQRDVREDARQIPMTTEQQSWLKQELARLVNCNAVEVMGSGERPQGIRAISPVFLVPKQGLKRWRLVIDLRRVNSTLPARPCKFETLSTLARMAGKGWWCLTFDLAQGYHHIEMTPNSREWLGFKVLNCWYRYKVLPFGLSWSPCVFTKVVRQTVRWWRKQGVFVMAYVDDFIVLAPTKEELLKVRDHIIVPTLDRLGWIREPSKGQWEPVQSLVVLGLGINLLTGRFFVPNEKQVKVQNLCMQVVKRMWSTKRELARVGGYLNSISRAAPIIQVYLREMYSQMNQATTWKTKICLTADARNDLQWIATNLAEIHGAPMWRPAKIMVVETDASLEGWGAYLPSLGLSARGHFQENMQQWFIHYKEMQACLQAVLAFSSHLQGKEVEIHTDNMMVRCYLARGGGSDKLMTQMTKQIHIMLAENEAKLYTAVWIKGKTENQIADWLSRHQDGDDWELRQETVILLWHQFGGWTVDRFADSANAKAPRFNSLLWCRGTEAVNSFTQDWRHEMNLLVPPLYLIMRTLQHLIETKARGIIVVPQWEGQAWWPMLMGVSQACITLGSGWQIAKPGPSGWFEPGQQRWLFQAHFVDGTLFQRWRC